ncbi:hypothetical protein [Luteolibacter marinus]|uniref:hypothetical protein n=1 Tax=Luteolibacter marinus TaxID=2776705 RepID=UPI0018660793|nr:hypothetical protein [Luteolibacter marinus]
MPASKQTSTIPLKKETVRVTLKASDAPPAAPGAPSVPKPTLAPTAPPAPSAPAPSVGAPKAPAPAPTIALRPAGAPSAPAPAPTIKLNTPTGAGAPGVALKTAPLGGAPAAGPTVSLPKATVQLQPPTQPIGTSGPSLSQAATIHTADDEEEESGSMAANVLSILGFLGAAAVLVIQFMTVNVWGTIGDLF